jgi:hypothetical protein
LKLSPDDFKAQYRRLHLFLRVGKNDEARDELNLMVPQHPSVTTYNSGAWLLATYPDDKFRDGARAIELAIKACELTDYKDGGVVDTLAAAYAESGDFKRAVTWEQKQAEHGVNEEIVAHLKSFQSRKPWREEEN